jgi:murein DD-endopeptidase MepM/ murein hydrolase activator NlpD
MESMRILIAGLLLGAPLPPPEEGPLFRSIELRLGESADVELGNGRKTTLKLLDLGGRIAVDGETVTLRAGRDRLPITVAGVQIDGPFLRAEAARFRIWPAGSPWERPGRFRYPLRQRWSAGPPRTDDAPCFAEDFFGTDLSGCEELVDVLSLADGVIVGARGELQPEHRDVLRGFGSDQVLIRDVDGWYVRTAGLHAIDPSVKLGRKVYRGQKLGTLGKRLHVDLRHRDADGRWVPEDAYAFLWEAYRREYGEDALAADPAPLQAAYFPTFGIQPGDLVTFKSRAPGTWDFGDGTRAEGRAATHAFARPGRYEIQVDGTARLQVIVGEPTRPGKPFGGKFHVIPGRIEAEDYDEGPAGVAYEDADVKNNGADYRGKVGVDIEPRAEASGGFNLGWTRPGEWTAYTVDVRESGVYDIHIPVACLQKGGTFFLEFNGKNVSGPIQVPDTGAWEILKPFRHESVRLSAGTYVMKARLDTPGERGSIGDLDYFEFVRKP